MSRECRTKPPEIEGLYFVWVAHPHDYHCAFGRVDVGLLLSAQLALVNSGPRRRDSGAPGGARHRTAN
jgi:hypothetical protein